MNQIQKKRRKKLLETLIEVEVEAEVEVYPHLIAEEENKTNKNILKLSIKKGKKIKIRVRHIKMIKRRKRKAPN